MCFEVHLTQTKLLIFLGEEVLCFWKSEKAPDSVRRYAVVNTKNKFKGADNLSVWYPAVIVEIEEVTVKETPIKKYKVRYTNKNENEEEEIDCLYEDLIKKKIKVYYMM